MSTQTIVNVTPNYRIVAESNQYVVQRHHTVDPTLAPGWEKRVADATTNGETPPDSSIREEWRDIAYYGANPDGLAAAINSVIIREVPPGEMSLPKYVESVRSIAEGIRTAIEGGFYPSEHRNLGA